MAGLREQLRESAGAFRDVFRNRDLRHLELAWAGTTIAHWAYGVGVTVFAYTAGGASAVGLLLVLRSIPAAIVSPFAATLADRYRRELVMIGSDLVRAALIAITAVAIYADASPTLVYVLAALVQLVAAPFRPAQAAVIPSLAGTPSELTAANATSSTIESVGFFIGPAVAGLLLALSSPGLTVAVTAGGFLWSALLVSRIRGRKERPVGAGRAASTILSETAAGFRAILADSRLWILMGLLAAQTFVFGGLEVLVVNTAIAVLGLSQSAVGFLRSSFGVGALIGAVIAFGLVGIRRLSLPFLVGIVLWGAPLALVGIWPSTALAAVCFAFVGAGNTLVDVAGFTLVQRATPDEVLARVFGVMQMIWFGTIGIGAIVTAQLVNSFGGRDALIIVGLFLPVLAAILGPRLVRIDAAATVPAAELELLRTVPIFAPLPGAPLEHLAGRLVPLRVEAGTDIVRQGEAGDRFYIIAEGEVEIAADRRELATMGPGGYFGEIALLRDVPRTATVRAKTPVVLYALEREDFVAAVTSHAPSASAADAVVGARLGGLPSEPAAAS